MNLTRQIIVGCLLLALIGTGCSTAKTGGRIVDNTGVNVASGTGQAVQCGTHVATSGVKLGATAGTSAVSVGWTLLCFPVEMVKHPFKTPFRTVGKLTKTSANLVVATAKTAGGVVTSPKTTALATNPKLVKAAATGNPHAIAAQVAVPVLADAAIRAVR